ncbi:MAG: DEAD/DEAH box helicase family protein [Nostoc sp.]
MSGKTKLFGHQKEALVKIWEQAANGELEPRRRSPNSGASLLVMGVGTGKTAVLTSLPFVLAPYMQGRQTMIVVDNCTLRGRILQDFPTDSRHCPVYEQWPLYNLGILPPGVPPPQIAELRAEDWKSYGFNLDSADLLVVNRQFLLQLVSRGDIDPGNVGLLLIDEAHHSPASSYRTVFEYFSTSMLVFLTGSRFRSDSKPIPYIRYNTFESESETGSKLMRYSPMADFEFSIQDAWKLDPPPIKKLMYKEATSRALLVLENGVEVEYSREGFFAKAESDREWLRQILLADAFCMPVLQQAVSILKSKRATGQPHKMIVRALNINHAHRLFKLLESFDLLAGKVGLVHSDKDGFDLAGRPTEVYKKFFSGEYICLVHCSMVGEGFSHEWASVCVPLCVIRSLTVAEQEFGRIIRRVQGRPPGKFPDYNHENWGVVVTHEMLEIGPLFQKFIEGMPTAPLSGYGETPSLSVEPILEKPRLTSEYEAGETTLTLTNTQTLKPGDLILLSATIQPVAQPIPKFDLVEELRSTGSLSIDNIEWH